MSYHKTNETLATLFNLPKMTQRAVIVIRADGPPLIRVTRLMIDRDDFRQISERFELRKISASKTAEVTA